jgi:hypothetical protein
MVDRAASSKPAAVRGEVFDTQLRLAGGDTCPYASFFAFLHSSQGHTSRRNDHE